ncbi:hypothetical protein MTO96_045850 [Rhipicephalus appendiculatus]
MAAHASPPAFDEEAGNWEAYRLRLEAYFEVHDVAGEKKRRAISGSGQRLGNIRRGHSGSYFGAAGILWARSVGGTSSKPWNSTGRQVLAVGTKAAKPSSTEDESQVQQLLDEFQELLSEELGLIKGAAC